VAVQNPVLLVVICLLIALEINHLKWIWWTYWECKTCGETNKQCGCGRRKWIMYL
jgi:hypothetical protein